MDPNTWTIIATILVLWGTLLGFIWALHRDIGDLRERMARLEGLFEGFVESQAQGKNQGY